MFSEDNSSKKFSLSAAVGRPNWHRQKILTVTLSSPPLYCIPAMAKFLQVVPPVGLLHEVRRMFQKTLSCILAALLVGHSAVAATPAAPAGPACPLNLELSQSEFDAFIMFNARLSHLLDFYGTPGFEGKLQSIVESYWPKTLVIQVSPFFFEKVANLVDQARLRHSIALTVGLGSDSWYRFERPMKDISLMQQQGFSLVAPIEQTVQTLLKEISAAKKPAAVAAELWELQKAEAIMRVSQMFDFMMRWRVLNGNLIDERAAASAKSVAVLAIGLVGAGVLGSTLVVSAPVVSGAGLLAARIATTPAMARLLMKVAETAAGSAIGFFGAPAAIVVQDSYQAYSEATKQSANNQTSFSCEIAKQNELWRQQAGGKLMSAALIGASMGLGGGVLTFTTRSARLVLYATGFGVGVAQLYALGKMSASTVESLALYKMAEESEAAGKHEQALDQLFRARDLAQEAGEHGLEAIIISTLSYHVGNHFTHALHKGASAIRQLYAASADTLPTAAHAVVDTAKAVIDVTAKKSTP